MASKTVPGEIAFAQIFPPIGIARLGDSDSSYFIGPELGDVFDEGGTRESFRYRDEEGRIRRQAARFRVYGFDKDGNLVQELTASNAKIKWTVRVANKKAAWFKFTGAADARAQFHGKVAANPK